MWRPPTRRRTRRAGGAGTHPDHPPLTRREQVAEVVVGGGFVVACLTLALTASHDQALELGPALVAIAALALASRVRFPVHGGFTVPIVLVFVPVLFLIPLPFVPPLTAVALALGVAPDVLRGRVPASRLLFAAANSWFSIGPVVVLSLAGVTDPRAASSLVLLGALGAQFATDLGASALRERIVAGPSLREQIADVSWVYAVDAALAPIGLLAALAAADLRYAVVLLLPLLCLLALFATERRRRFESLSELSSAYRGTALVLADVVEADDAYTGQHCKDVVELSLRVADAMGLRADQRRNVEFGALLHDVGKVAIPKEIINKPGPLSEAEWDIIRTHTIEGHRMLSKVGGIMREVGLVVRASHERWDGGGYPDGLIGQEIPLEARIVTCCDSYSAMTSTRSYRPAMTHAEAVAELRSSAGSQLDPMVVGVLIDCMAREPGLVPAPALRLVPDREPEMA